eukprot:CAMPEP_0181366342 /NCGR_PEP_ID=MMETSP1106-20121128/10639_1 /TAXON_ID=81844 /ORGANISM="Mantoniella antarctica, Strain SL-175" /LENGTH=94 /DNA_ID=CAMNT_0023481657 /DNA_START=147 /DNA_END=428 /DNA_ORIENTATION=-
MAAMSALSLSGRVAASAVGARHGVSRRAGVVARVGQGGDSASAGSGASALFGSRVMSAATATLSMRPTGSRGGAGGHSRVGLSVVAMARGRGRR